jgi:epoxyqueuosine reductase
VPIDSREIVGLCLGHGFAMAGVADAAPAARREELLAWIGAGKHGTMGYLAEQLEARLDPARVLPDARSVIMVADVYAARDGAEDAPPPGTGRIARYARGRDYHRVMKKRLHRIADALRLRFPGAGFRAFVDTAPMLEREYAARAGLGWVGKNTLLINPRLGSYTLLGGLLTTLELDAAPAPEPNHCGTCTRCIDACPTGAISPYSVDGSRCISYLTIERRGPIEAAAFGPVGDWLYGCDVCQEVCPHNSPRSSPTGEVSAEYAPRRSGFDLLEVLGWDEERRRTAFEGSAMKRATLAMMKRNALIVAGNQLRQRDDPALRARIGQVADDAREPDLVRETARSVLASLPSHPKGSRKNEGPDFPGLRH